MSSKRNFRKRLDVYNRQQQQQAIAALGRLAQDAATRPQTVREIAEQAQRRAHAAAVRLARALQPERAVVHGPRNWSQQDEDAKTEVYEPDDVIVAMSIVPRKWTQDDEDAKTEIYEPHDVVYPMSFVYTQDKQATPQGVGSSSLREVLDLPDRTIQQRPTVSDVIEERKMRDRLGVAVLVDRVRRYKEAGMLFTQGGIMFLTKWVPRVLRELIIWNGKYDEAMAITDLQTRRRKLVAIRAALKQAEDQENTLVPLTSGANQLRVFDQFLQPVAYEAGDRSPGSALCIGTVVFNLGLLRQTFPWLVTPGGPLGAAHHAYMCKLLDSLDSIDNVDNPSSYHRLIGRIESAINEIPEPPSQQSVVPLQADKEQSNITAAVRLRK